MTRGQRTQRTASGREPRLGRRPTVADIVVGVRLLIVNGIHPGMIVEVVHVNASTAQVRYVKRKDGGKADSSAKFRFPHNWIISHTEVIE